MYILNFVKIKITWASFISRIRLSIVRTNAIISIDNSITQASAA